MEVSFRRRRNPWLITPGKMKEEGDDDHELRGALMVKFPRAKNWRRRYFLLHQDALWYGQDVSNMDQCLDLKECQIRRGYQATLQIINTSKNNPLSLLLLRMESILARNRWHERLVARQDFIVLQEIARQKQNAAAAAASKTSAIGIKVVYPNLLKPTNNFTAGSVPPTTTVMTTLLPSYNRHICDDSGSTSDHPTLESSEYSSHDDTTSTTATSLADDISTTTWSSVRSHLNDVLQASKWRGSVRCSSGASDNDTVVSVLSDCFSIDSEKISLSPSMMSMRTTMTSNDEHDYYVATVIATIAIQRVWRGSRVRQTYASVLRSRLLQRFLRQSQNARLRIIIETSAICYIQQWYRQQKLCQDARRTAAMLRRQRQRNTFFWGCNWATVREKLTGGPQQKADHCVDDENKVLTEQAKTMAAGQIQKSWRASQTHRIQKDIGRRWQLSVRYSTICNHHYWRQHQDSENSTRQRRRSGLRMVALLLVALSSARVMLNNKSSIASPIKKSNTALLGILPKRQQVALQNGWNVLEERYDLVKDIMVPATADLVRQSQRHVIVCGSALIKILQTQKQEICNIVPPEWSQFLFEQGVPLLQARYQEAHDKMTSVYREVQGSLEGLPEHAESSCRQLQALFSSTLDLLQERQGRLLSMLQDQQVQLVRLFVLAKRRILEEIPSPIATKEIPVTQSSKAKTRRRRKARNNDSVLDNEPRPSRWRLRGQSSDSEPDTKQKQTGVSASVQAAAYVFRRAFVPHERFSFISAATNDD